jgi:hypothetical protein
MRTVGLSNGESPMLHFVNDGEGAATAMAQEFNGDGLESVTWTIVVTDVSCSLSRSRLKAGLAGWAKGRT